MHDLKAIRENPIAFDIGLARRGLAGQAQELHDRDKEVRRLKAVLQDWATKRKANSDAFLAAKRQGNEPELARLKTEGEAYKNMVPQVEEQLRMEESRLKELLERIPNIPATDVPDGKNENDNVELYRWPEKLREPNSADERTAAAKASKRRSEVARLNCAREHFEIGEAMGLMDFETAAKMSGARFVLLSGALARMERALANLMLDTHTEEFGYTECSPPLMVNDSALFGTGQLPKFGADLFSSKLTVGQMRVKAPDWVSRPTKEFPMSAFTLGPVNPDDLKEMQRLTIELGAPEVVSEPNEGFIARFTKGFRLIPTAEVSLTNIVSDCIIDEEDLPRRYTAWTPCFRSEAGAAGKDTRGMIRMHQFSKVELVSVTAPEKSQEEHERMTGCAEAILKKLELPFRTVALCAGDMGFQSMKTYDIEVWLPGQNRYREISSCSNCGDFQARRMKARLRRKGAKGTEFVHTLNGSGLAVGRTLVAILENYQQADGSVVVPEALRGYMGGMKVIGSSSP